MTLKQISVFVENRPGKLQALTGVLAENAVNMRALSLAETSEFGIVRIIVDDLEAACGVLGKEGYVYTVTQVLGAAIPDEPGGLHRVLRILGEADINVEYMYAFLGAGDTPGACMIFHVQDVQAALKALEAQGVSCLTQEEVAG